MCVCLCVRVVRVCVHSENLMAVCNSHSVGKNALMGCALTLVSLLACESTGLSVFNGVRLDPTSDPPSPPRVSVVTPWNRTLPSHVILESCDLDVQLNAGVM